MRLTIKVKLMIVLEHIQEGQSFAYLGAKYQYDIHRIKYLVKLYKVYGSKPLKIGINKHIDGIRSYSQSNGC